MYAEYVSSNSFRVFGDESSEFIKDRRVKLNCGVDGSIIASVVSSVYDLTYTVVVIDEGGITANLVGVLYSVVKPGQEGNIANHTHTSSEGDGGELDIPMTFAGLNDTPSTYSGTEGYYLQSTGSGIDFLIPPPVLYLSENAPTGLEDRVIGDFAIASSEASVYVKTSGFISPTVQVKSVVLDINDNYGNTNYVGIRSVEFYNGDVLSTIADSDITCYATSTINDEYYSAKFVFITGLSKIGTQASTAWYSDYQPANQRVICVFESPLTFDRVVINNFHINGSSTDIGAKNVKIYTSTTSITDTTYGTDIPSSNLIFDSQFDVHVANDIEDSQELGLSFQDVTGWDEVFSAPQNLIELYDTPSTYSGTEGYYLLSTGSGTVFQEMPEFSTTFLDLEDTPTTYSGTEGYYLQSTGSGIICTSFEDNLLYSSVEVPSNSTGDIGDFYIVSSENSIYEKTSQQTDPYLIKYDNTTDLEYSYYLGTEYDGAAGMTTYNSPIAGTNYFTFNGTNCLYLSASVVEPYDVFAKFSIADLLPGNAQIIWRSGGSINGQALGLNVSGNLGVFCRNNGTLSSTTIDNSILVTDKIYYLYASYTLGKIYLYDDFGNLVTTTGSLSGVDGTNYESIGGLSCVSVYDSQSPITGTTYSTGIGVMEGFIGNIYEVELYPTGTFTDNELSNLTTFSGTAYYEGWSKILRVADSILDLNDTPTTYSGTEGYYLQSTGSGTVWTAISGGGGGTSDVVSFLDLEDAPSTYSGTEGQCLQSTGSGIEWKQVDEWVIVDNDPTIYTPEYKNGTYYLSTASSTIFQKARPVSYNFTSFLGEGIKSVILDLADNYGNSNYVAIRSVDFYYNNELIALTSSDFITYESSQFNVTYASEFAFDTSTSKIGAWENTSWLPTSGNTTNQRLVVVFNNLVAFDKVIINNIHHNGGWTDAGAKNVKIYTSTDTVTDTVYGNSISNSTLIFDGQFNQHIASDVEDSQTLELINNVGTYDTGWDAVLETKDAFLDLDDTPITYSGTEGYYLQSTGSGIEFLAPPANLYSSENVPTGLEENHKIGDFDIVTSEKAIYIKNRNYNSEGFIAKSIIIDIADNWGHTNGMGLREVDFYYVGAKLDLTSSDYTAYATTYYGNDSLPEYVFDTSLSLTGSYTYTSWWTYDNNTTNQRLICVFNTEQVFDAIKVNNWHTSGINPTYGVKNVKLYISTDAITDTTYNATITNSTLLFDGQFDQHIASDVEDTQTLDTVEPQVDVGWDKLLTIPKTLLELDDTPTTYSGGQYLVSTSSGINYLTPPANLYSSENVPTGLEENRNIGDFTIVTSKNSIYEKTDLYYSEAFTAKSIILDIADNWGDLDYLGLREVDFYLEGSKLALTASDYTAQAPSYISSNYLPENIFDTSKNLTGDPNDDNNSWLGTNGNAANQRVSVVFNSEITFDAIVVNNFHYTGTSTDRGAKNVKIYTSPDSITSTTYGTAISNGTLIFDGQFDQHINSDVVDSQELVLIYDSSDVVTGWNEVLSVPKALIGLDDTPITYSGSENLILKSTGSGIGFYTPPPVLYTSENIPTGLEEAAIGDFDIVISEQSIYIKNRILTEGNISAKSVILDIADGWGSTILGVRSVDFMYSGEIIPNIATTNFVAYATTDLGTGYEPELSFDTSTSKLSGYNTNQWLSGSGASTNQRLICVFNSEIMFDSIVINNTHSNGAGTDQGSKNVKITVSTDTITDTTYNTSVSNSYVIFDGQFDEHVTSNVEDPQELSVQGEISDTGWDEVLAVSKNFTDLADTPTTYSGGQYLRTTSSGIDAIDGIILKAPNESEWLIKVTNSGTLYTVGV